MYDKLFVYNRDACIKFIELWKRKHENGQWVDIEDAEAVSNHLDYANINASGIVLSDMVNKPKAVFPESPNGIVSEENGKATAAVNAGTGSHDFDICSSLMGSLHDNKGPVLFP